MSYLSELFLDTLGSDYSRESVNCAVMACNAEYETRMTEVPGKELRDFWEVYREFDEGGPNVIAPLIIASCRSNYWTANLLVCIHQDSCKSKNWRKSLCT